MSLNNSKSGFSVRDILDLPDTSDEGSVTEDTEDEADEGFSGNQQRASSRDALWLGSPCGHKYQCRFTSFNDLNKYLKLVLCYFNIFKKPNKTIKIAKKLYSIPRNAFIMRFYAFMQFHSYK